MISPELRKQIFVAVPLSFTTENGTFPVHKEYAPYAKVTEYLKAHPNDVYIAIDFVDDEVRRSETPINYVFRYDDMKTETGETETDWFKEINLVKGTRNNCAMNLHVYATWQPNTQNTILAMEEILNQLQSWTLFELEKVVDYPRFNSIQAIDETSDRLLHRVIAITFSYTNVPNYHLEKNGVTTRGGDYDKVVLDGKNTDMQYNIDKQRIINGVYITVKKVSPLPVSTTNIEAIAYGDSTDQSTD